jgi:hypothetical protein
VVDLEAVAAVTGAVAAVAVACEHGAGDLGGEGGEGAAAGDGDAKLVDEDGFDPRLRAELFDDGVGELRQRRELLVRDRACMCGGGDVGQRLEPAGGVDRGAPRPGRHPVGGGSASGGPRRMHRV